ncbi:acyltransferase family protein [Pseudomonas bharatica]|uniref:acyltransferase family protein n=1 Tax=Pseudomonas bharatica TaxID=2692112 RepID=UPI00289D0324|nr:acyltransferase family protein [Pseudomonas bharatica]
MAERGPDRGALAATHWAIARFVGATPQIAEYPISLQQWWLAYYFPPLRLFEFVLGMLMARILMAGRWPAIPVAPTMALAALAYFLAGEVPFIYSLSLTTVIPIALLITSLAAADVTRRRSWFRHPLMVWLGEISFGFYMIHLLIMTCVTNLLGGQTFAAGPAALILIATFALSLLGGWLLFASSSNPPCAAGARPARRHSHWACPWPEPFHSKGCLPCLRTFAN